MAAIARWAREGPSYWIVRPPAKSRAVVAAVIDWLRWQAAAAGRLPARP